jgi:hypothetical protein
MAGRGVHEPSAGVLCDVAGREKWHGEVVVEPTPQRAVRFGVEAVSPIATRELMKWMPAGHRGQIFGRQLPFEHEVFDFCDFLEFVDKPPS